MSSTTIATSLLVVTNASGGTGTLAPEPTTTSSATNVQSSFFGNNTLTNSSSALAASTVLADSSAAPFQTSSTESVNSSSKSHVLVGTIAGFVVVVIGVVFGVYYVRKRRREKRSQYRQGGNMSMRPQSNRYPSMLVSMNVGVVGGRDGTDASITSLPSYSQHDPRSMRMNDIEDGAGIEFHSGNIDRDHHSMSSLFNSTAPAVPLQQTTPATSSSVSSPYIDSNPFSDPPSSSRRDPFSDTRSIFSVTSTRTTLPGYTEYEATALDSNSMTSDLPPLYENLHTTRRSGR